MHIEIKMGRIEKQMRKNECNVDEKIRFWAGKICGNSCFKQQYLQKRNNILKKM